MNHQFLQKLEEMNLELPKVSIPGGAYDSVNVRGKVAYIAVQFPIYNGEFFYQGVLGDSLTTEDGVKAMEMCALNVLAQVYHKVGFDNIEGLNHIEASYRATETWDNAPLVVNGASETFLKVLGEKGKHSRSLFGVKDLPRQFCVGLTSSFTIK